MSAYRYGICNKSWPSDLDVTVQDLGFYRRRRLVVEEARDGSEGSGVDGEGAPVVLRLDEDDEGAWCEEADRMAKWRPPACTAPPGITRRSWLPRRSTAYMAA